MLISLNFTKTDFLVKTNETLFNPPLILYNNGKLNVVIVLSHSIILGTMNGGEKHEESACCWNK